MVSVAIVNVIANANVTFFSLVGVFFFLYLSSTCIILSATILSEPRWTTEKNHRKIKTWLPVFRAGALRSPSCRLKRSSYALALFPHALLLSFCLVLPLSSFLYLLPLSHSASFLEDMKKGNWEHTLLLLRYWTSHWHPVIRIHSL